MTAPTERSTVRRVSERGVYDRETIDAIFDEALICHIAFASDTGPVAIPTIHARVGDVLYLHGSHASRMMRSVEGAEVCVTATLVDGIVVARSAFHHSLNYRSAIVFGVPRVVDDPEERTTAFAAITNHVVPGRWDEARRPTDKEDKGTRLLAVAIDEASAKVRTGPPVDDDDDLDSGIWAGVIPLGVVAGVPVPAPDLDPDVPLAPSVSDYRAN